MNTRKKLLSIRNLKKYFPIAKQSIFQKEQYYVRANEDITFDVYEGETIGVVGESGCGKSTLGRVLLQLYPQTAGTSTYYGKSRSEIAPKYMVETLTNVEKHIKTYKLLQEKAQKLVKECDDLGESANFLQLQNKNLAVAEAQTALYNVASIIGGFMVADNVKECAAVLLKKYNIEKTIAVNKDSIAKLNSKVDYYNTKVEEEDGEKGNASKISAYKSKIDSFSAKIAEQEKAIDGLKEKIALIDGEIDGLKQKIKDNPEFEYYEQMLDDGVDLARLTYDEMRHLRNDLQIIFQDPYSSLDPRMTVGQTIEEGLVTHGYFRHGSAKMKEYILETMEKCGLQDYMLHRYPHQFSGGQRQRICIARALAVKPKFVVCDECVSALDVSIQSQIINLLLDLKEKNNLTYLFISHDLSVVRYISDRILVMYLGNIVEFTSAEKLFADPRHPYTLALLSSIPTTDPDSLKKERILLEGNIPSPIRPPSGCKFHTRCYMATEKCKCVPPPFVEVTPEHFVACHYADRKIDENGNYLFDVPKTAKMRAEKVDNGQVEQSQTENCTCQNCQSNGVAENCACQNCQSNGEAENSENQNV